MALSFTMDQLESMFSEPFSDPALDYAEAIYSSIELHYELLRRVPVTYLLTNFHQGFRAKLLNVLEQYSMLRSFILRNDLEVFGVYRHLIEMEEIWLYELAMWLWLSINANDVIDISWELVFNEPDHFGG